MADSLQRTRRRLQAEADTRPGQVLLLSLLAAAPVMVAFVLAPVLAGPGAARALAPVVLYATPVFAVWSIVVLARAPAEKRSHRASRIGLLLDGVALFLWLLVLVSALAGRL